MNNWKKTTLGEVCNFRRGHDLPKYDMQEGMVPVAGSNGIIGYHDKQTNIEPCITIGRSGNVGTPYYYEKCWAHNTVLYIDDYKGNDPKFIYYFIKTLNLGNYSGGSAVPTLNRNHIHPIEVYFPIDIDEQKRIADVLSALDDKIEINNKINENLEAQAQAIFKQWFVDFEFPDKEGKPYKTNGGKFIDSELGEIPLGWKVGTLGNFTTNERVRVGNNNYTVLSPVNSGELLLSEDIFNKQVYSKDISKYLIVEKDAFAYNPARVNIGSIGRNKFDFIGCVSPVYVVFKTENKYQNFFEEYIKTERFKTEVLSRAIGGVRQTLNYSDFSLITTIYPPEDIIILFNQFYNDKEEMIKQNKIENKTLSEIRDSLLPKLMSGEIRV